MLLSNWITGHPASQLPSTCWQKYIVGLDCEWTASISPLEGLGHGLVEIVYESQNSISQLSNRSEVASFENPADQNTEPDFNLIEPGSMLGCVDKSDPMRRILEKGRTRFHGFQDTELTFDAQVSFDPTPFCHQANQAF